MPFVETDKADTQLTGYSATKKANESMAHSYAHLWDLPTTMFRFFTVYGPWGRPDLAYYKFVGRSSTGGIDVYNHGDMYRDFTHVGDLVNTGSGCLVDGGTCDRTTRTISPTTTACRRSRRSGSSTSGTRSVKLLDFIDAIEDALGIKATRYMDAAGRRARDRADTRLLRELTGFEPDRAPVQGRSPGVRRLVPGLWGDP